MKILNLIFISILFASNTALAWGSPLYLFEVEGTEKVLYVEKSYYHMHFKFVPRYRVFYGFPGHLRNIPANNVVSTRRELLLMDGMRIHVTDLKNARYDVRPELGEVGVSGDTLGFIFDAQAMPQVSSISKIFKILNSDEFIVVEVFRRGEKTFYNIRKGPAGNLAFYSVSKTFRSGGNVVLEWGHGHRLLFSESSSQTKAVFFESRSLKFITPSYENLRSFQINPRRLASRCELEMAF